MPDPFEQLWANVPEYNPFAPRAPEGPCAESTPFAQWCARLLACVAEDPSPERFLIAKARLLDAYCRWQAKTSDEHRAFTVTHDVCYHSVLLGSWHDLENRDLLRPPRELAPPKPQIIESSATVREEPLEPSGVIAGYEDAE